MNWSRISLTGSGNLLRKYSCLWICRLRFCSVSSASHLSFVSELRICVLPQNGIWIEQAALFPTFDTLISVIPTIFDVRTPRRQPNSEVEQQISVVPDWADKYSWRTFPIDVGVDVNRPVRQLMLTKNPRVNAGHSPTSSWVFLCVFH